MSSELHCRIATRWSELEGLETEWDALVADHPRPQVFFSFAWHRATWVAFGDERELAIGLALRRDPASDAEVLCGVLPLSRTRGAADFEFLGAPHADYADLLLRRGEGPAEILHVLLEAAIAAGVGRARLRHVPEGGWFAQAARAMRASDSAGGLARRLVEREGDVCPALVVDDAATLEACIRKKSLRRHENGLERRGKVTFERLETTAEVQAMQSLFREQHRQRRALAGDTSLFDKPQSCAFYDALIRELAADGPLHFTVLKCGDEVAACHLGFEVAGVLTWYKPTIAVDLWDLGPGEVLIKRLLETVRDRGLREFDFTRGDEAFKQRFANRLRHNADFLLLPGGLAGSWKRGALRLEDAVRARPRLHRAAKSLRGTVAEGKRVVRRHGLGVVGKILRRAWSGYGLVRDEVTVFRQSRPTTPALSLDGLEIEIGALSTLAAIASAHEHFDERRLQAARKRLKSGDRLVVAWLPDRSGESVDRQFAHAAWMGARDQIVATEVGTELALDLPRTGTVIYDCWTPTSMRGRGVYPAVIAHMASLASTEDVWIYCLTDNVASLRGIEKAGFKVTHRMERRRRFGRRVDGGIEAV